MIIQCDQCNTKFRLDDSKITEKGAKVRCAKCKHIFMVQKEIPAEEPDLDFLLSGLGASPSNVEAGASQAGEAASPEISGEEWPSFTKEIDTPLGKEPNEAPVAGSIDQAGDEEFGADFFSAKEEPVTPDEKGFEFGEFPIAEEPSAAPAGAVAVSEATSGEMEGFEFGDFPFEEENNVPFGASVAPGTAPVETEKFDFGDAAFDTGESATIMGEEGLRSVAAGEPKEELFSFGEEPSEMQIADKGAELRLGLPEETEEAFDFGLLAVPSQQEKEAESTPFLTEEEKKGPEAESLDFGDIDFGESIIAGPRVTKKEEIEPNSDEPVVSSESFLKKPSASFFASQMSSAEQELPLLAISTRRKANSIFPIVMTAIAVLILLLLAGAGFYVFKEGPAAFDKLGLSFLAKWAGLEVVNEGRIAVKNPQGVFMTNQAGGEIFVISGEAVNNFKKPRASIQVKATILGPKGEALMQKTAYCGNLLSKEQLATLPMAKIEEAMGSPFGDSLANLSVQPGKGIPFVIVFSGVPKNASEFSVEIVGSTVASQS